MRRGIGRLRAGGSGVALPTTTAMEAWYRKGTGITSAANAVSNWANQDSHGAARDCAQATGAAQPNLQGAGTILFNGSSHFLKTAAFTLNQPETICLRARQITWVQNAAWFDGGAANTGAIFDNTATPGITAYAGANGPSSAAAPVLNAWSSIVVVLNGASSVLYVDGVSNTGGAGGAANMGGLTLGALGSGLAAFKNLEVAEVIVYSDAKNAAGAAALTAYLNTL